MKIPLFFKFDSSTYRVNYIAANRNNKKKKNANFSLWRFLLFFVFFLFFFLLGAEGRSKGWSSKERLRFEKYFMFRSGDHFDCFDYFSF